jgi:hypothetical protein
MNTAPKQSDEIARTVVAELCSSGYFGRHVHDLYGPHHVKAAAVISAAYAPLYEQKEAAERELAAYREQEAREIAELSEAEITCQRGKKHPIVRKDGVREDCVYCQAEQKEELVRGLRWALQYIKDGMVKHDCAVFLSPETGKCWFCENHSEAEAALEKFGGAS